MTEKTADSPRRALFRAALWAFATRWSIRAIGLVNTVIMARILSPEDYGVVALATIISGAIQTLLDFGASQSLLRKDKLIEEEIHTVWTLRLIQCCVAASILLATSNWMADYFRSENLVYVLWTLAASSICSGLSSLGSTLALKNYNFSIDFKINVSGKIVGVAATIIFGLIFKDYRALIIGIVASQLTAFILGYKLYPYRPRLCLTHIQEVWQISKWLIVSNLGAYILNKGDQLVAAKVATPHDYGIYNVGGDLGAMPIQEAGPALLRAILPVLGNYSDNLERANQIALKAYATISGILWGLSGWVCLVSTQLTGLILGEKWAGAEIYVAFFAVISTLQVTFSPFGSLLLVHGDTKKLGMLVWLELAIFASTAALLLQSSGLIGLAIARLISIIIRNQILSLILGRNIGIKYFRELALPSFRHIGAAIIAALSPFALTSLSDVSMMMQLLIYTLCYFSLYCLVSLMTWQLFGRPIGIEAVILEYAIQGNKSTS